MHARTHALKQSQAFELAYSDVRRAFHNFLDRTERECADESEGADTGTTSSSSSSTTTNNNTTTATTTTRTRYPRPFVLASHSQGGHHLIRLLEEEVESRADLLARCVCVYLVGSKIPMDKLDPSVGLRHFRMSSGPRDTRCLVAWDAATIARGVVTHPRVSRSLSERLQRLQRLQRFSDCSVVAIERLQRCSDATI
jgi:hypothetical protein